MKILYDGWVKVEEIEAEIKGKKVIREKVHLNNAVAGIVTDSKGKIALVKQYRPTCEQETLEIPAGILDKPELTPYGTMLEELQEECGIGKVEIDSVDVAEIPFFVPVVGCSDSHTSLYRIKLNVEMEEVYYVNDKDVISVQWVTFSHLEKLVKSGEIIDGKTLLTYYILKGEQ